MQSCRLGIHQTGGSPSHPPRADAAPVTTRPGAGRALERLQFRSATPRFDLRRFLLESVAASSENATRPSLRHLVAKMASPPISRCATPFFCYAHRIAVEVVMLVRFGFAIAILAASFSFADAQTTA